MRAFNYIIKKIAAIFHKNEGIIIYNKKIAAIFHINEGIIFYNKKKRLYSTEMRALYSITKIDSGYLPQK